MSKFCDFSNNIKAFGELSHWEQGLLIGAGLLALLMICFFVRWIVAESRDEILYKDLKKDVTMTFKKKRGKVE
ncbi:MAG: hypothetical protein ACR2N8_04765 [Parvibaculales bacterium]